jgi:copper/silver efflux system protein
MNIADVHEVVRFGIGGMNVTETVEGLERFPVNLRFRPTGAIRPTSSASAAGHSGRHPDALGEIASIEIADGPAMIRSENTRPAGFVFVDIADRDLAGWVREARQAMAEGIELPAGYSIRFAGQYQYLERARERLSVLIPLVLAIIVVLLMMIFRTGFEVALVLITIPLSLAGGFWLMWLLDFQMSIGVAVGFIAWAAWPPKPG